MDSHPYRSKSIGHTIPVIWLFQDWTLKIHGQGHRWGQISRSHGESNILSTHILFVQVNRPSHSWHTAILKFHLENKVKVMGDTKVHGHVEGHIMVPTSNRLQSTTLLFHVNMLSHSWDMAISKFDLENPRSRFKFKATYWAQFLLTNIPLVHVNRPSHSWYRVISNWPWKS